jgi:hypothetical protein
MLFMEDGIGSMDSNPRTCSSRKVHMPFGIIYPPISMKDELRKKNGRFMPILL